MLDLIIIIIELGVLVLVHEAGHFFVAKKSGMQVEEFGFGFPPRIWGIKKGETIYSINAIPFGGFVKILGEDGAERENPRSFASGKAVHRGAVLLAGVVMNLVLAFVLLSIVNFSGARVGLADTADAAKARDIRIQITDVAAGSPAQMAGLKPLDTIRGFKTQDGVINVTETEEVQEYVGARGGQEIILLIDRDDGESPETYREIRATPKFDEQAQKGRLGLSMAKTGIIQYGPLEAIVEGAKDTYYLLIQIISGLWLIFTNLIKYGKVGVDLAGPVGIAMISGDAYRIGFSYLVQFVAFLSINLAVLNALPIPALDGGRFLFLIIEKIKGRPLPKRAEATLNTVSFLLLICLMVYVTTKDIVKLF